MGQAAYECGRFAYSVAELSAAEDDDARDLKAATDGSDDIDPDLISDLRADREWLSLAYAATRQPKLANEACLRAHPGWKGCTCIFRDKKPFCTEVAQASR